MAVTDIYSQLTRDEGLQLKPYRDTVGKLTIGVGRNLDDVGISSAEANYLLGNDVAMATGAIRQRLPWADDLDEVRFGALVNMAFNLGIGGLVKFPKFLTAMQAGNWPEAVTELENSLWYSQVGDRAKRLVTQILTGQWQ